MIRGGRLEGVMLHEDDLREGAFDTEFVNCTFTGNLKSVRFINCIFTNCRIETAFWDRVDISTCRMENTHLLFFKMKRVTFPEGFEPTFGDTVTKRAFAISRGSQGVKRMRT